MERGRFLRDLWDAHDAVESEAFAARRNDDPSLGIERDEQARQILDWKDLVEAEISFLVANSLRGALIQLALMQDAMNDLDDRIEKSNCDSAREIAIKIGRLLRSASDAVHDAMGEDQYAEVSGIVFAEYRADRRYTKLDPKSKRNHEVGFKLVGGYVLKGGKRLGEKRLSTIDTALVDDLYEVLLILKFTDGDGNVVERERRTTINHAMKSCRRAWNVAGRRNPGRLPQVNPFCKNGIAIVRPRDGDL